MVRRSSRGGVESRFQRDADGPSPPTGRPAAVGGGFSETLQRRLALGFVAAVILFIALVRVRVADVPLERDEGEYAYAGQLILQGIPPYQQAFNMKFPGTYYAYAGIMALFGQTPYGIRLGLMLVNAATTFLVFAIGRRLSGNFAGATAAAAFAFLSTDPSALGVFAHATHFVLLPALAGLYLLLPGRGTIGSWRIVLSGALLGVAVLMKQHAALFVPLGALLLLAEIPGGFATRLRGAFPAITLLASGAIAPFAFLCALLSWQGVLGNFYFWTFQYAREYVSEATLAMAPSVFSESFARISGKAWIVWLIAGAGAVALWLPDHSAAERLFVTGLLVASFLAICPGFFFQDNYFILLLPAVALLTGIAFEALSGLVGWGMGPGASRIIAAAACLAVLAFVIRQEREFLFSMTPSDLMRSRYGTNPFIEAVAISDYIRNHTAVDDRIAVLGSEPEIYFYAQRRSVSGYIYMYPLMERQRFASQMQQEMIGRIEAAHPKFLVFVRVRASWLWQPDSDQHVLDWGEQYTQKCYDLVGIADIYSDKTSNVLWDSSVDGYKPLSGAYVFTFRRKGDAVCTAGGA
jgi:Dolichyl-phosphate-mannose-protein mannosyltransferase